MQDIDQVWLKVETEHQEHRSGKDYKADSWIQKKRLLFA